MGNERESGEIVEQAFMMSALGTLFEADAGLAARLALLADEVATLRQRVHDLEVALRAKEKVDG